jgi:hypothetical protein
MSDWGRRGEKTSKNAEFQSYVNDTDDNDYYSDEEEHDISIMNRPNKTKKQPDKIAQLLNKPKSETKTIEPNLIPQGENSSLKRMDLISQGENSSLKRMDLIPQGENPVVIVNTNTISGWGEEEEPDHSNIPIEIPKSLPPKSTEDELNDLLGKYRTSYPRMRNNKKKPDDEEDEIF